MEDEKLEATKTKAKEHLTCGLCGQTYSDPRRLPCSHSFCCRCIEAFCNLIQKNCNDRLGSFQCPICHMPIGIPNEGVTAFPADKRVNDIKESAVKEMQDILRRKLQARQGKFSSRSFDADSSDSESQTSDVPDTGFPEAGYSWSRHKRKPVGRHHQSFTTFDASQRQSETASQYTSGKVGLDRGRPAYSSLRETHRRKAQDLYAAFDRTLDPSQDSGLPQRQTDKLPKRESSFSSRYRTHQGESFSRESSSRSRFHDGKSSSAFGDGSSKFERMSDSLSSSTGSSFIRNQRGYQSLREKGSRRPHLPDFAFSRKKNAEESSFQDVEEQNADSGIGFNKENTETSASSKISKSKVELLVNGSSQSQKEVNNCYSNSRGGESRDSTFSSNFSQSRTPKVRITQTLGERDMNEKYKMYHQSLRESTVISGSVPFSELKITEDEEEESSGLGEGEVLREFNFLWNDDEGIGLDSERSDSVNSFNYTSFDANPFEQLEDLPSISSVNLTPQSSPGSLPPQAVSPQTVPKSHDKSNASHDRSGPKDVHEVIDDTKSSSNSGEAFVHSFGAAPQSHDKFPSDPFIQADDKFADQIHKTNSQEESYQCDDVKTLGNSNHPTSEGSVKLDRQSSAKVGDNLESSSHASENFEEKDDDVTASEDHKSAEDSSKTSQKTTVNEGSASLHHVSPEEYLMPTGVVILSQGSTVVADYGIGCLQYYTNDGSPLHRIEGIKPFSVTVNPTNDQVIVGDRRKKTVCLFDECGCDVAQWDSNMFKWICGIGVLRNGDLVVLDREKSQFGIYKPDGRLVHAFGSYGNSDGQLCMGEFLVVDGNDRIVACDSGNHCVKIFSVTGALLQQFGSRGDGDGEFQWPKGVCTDDLNNIIVADSCNSRVTMFSSDGSFIKHLVTNITMPYAVSYSKPNIAVTKYSVMGVSRFLLYNLAK